MTPLDALQETLAAEHVAVYTYGVLGGRISSSGYPQTAARLRAAYDAHRARRDRLRALVTDRGEVPAPPAAAYEVAGVPTTSRSPAALTAAARRTELGCAETYSLLVASTEGELRRLGVELLLDASVRALSFGSSPVPWPGAPDL